MVSFSNSGGSDLSVNELHPENLLAIGLSLAKQRGRHVFAIFTATELCHACSQLQARLLSQPEFLQFVQSEFVVVELRKVPPNSAPSGLTQHFMAQWTARLGITEVPTMVLLDHQVRPFYFQHGAASVANAIEQLKQAVAAKQTRDRAFEHAVSAPLSQKSLHLLQGLSAIEPFFQNSEQHFWVKYYLSEFEVILRQIQDGTSPLEPEQQKQIQKIASESQQSKVMEEMFSNVRSAIESSGGETGLFLLNSIIEQAEAYRIGLLQKMGAWSECLSISQNKSISTVSESERCQARSVEVLSLVHMGKVDEALSLARSEVARYESLNDSRRAKMWLETLGQWLLQFQPDAAVDVYQRISETRAIGSEEWIEAMGLRCLALRKSGEIEQSLAGYRQLLIQPRLDNAQRVAFTRRVVDLLVELGRHSEALREKEKAQKIIGTLPVGSYREKDRAALFQSNRSPQALRPFMPPNLN